MDKDYSFAALTRFLDFVAEKGLVKKNTAVSWKTASGKVLDDLTPAEQEDVRRVDLATAFVKFENRFGGKYSPASLAQYHARARTAMSEFLKWVESPTNYKPRALPKNDDGEVGGKIPRRQSRLKSNAYSGSGSAQARAPEPGITTPVTGLSLAFPMRSDFLAQVVVPRDISAEEARRFGAFIMTLAGDYKPGP